MAQPFTRLPSPRAAIAGLACILVFGWSLVMPPSRWWTRLSPDGSLNPGTDRFLDSLPMFLLGAGLLAIGYAAWKPMRAAMRAMLAEPTSPRMNTTAVWAMGWALATLASRLLVAASSDFGLGDDGARIFWLREWRRDPHWITSGLWVPGHLYVHALFNLVVHDAAWAGALLSALAAAGLVWILTRVIGEDWGTTAAACAGGAIALQPVALAYGANPDVNPFFAFLIVAAVAALARARRTQRRRWFACAWLCASLASWSRIESVFLLPLLSLPLWPRWRAMIRWTLAAFAAPAAWYVADSIMTGKTANVIQVMSRDPSLKTTIPAAVFSFLGALWQGITLPWLVLGVVGMASALRHRIGRTWIPIALVHIASLGGAALVLGAGLQARYFILPAALCAAYAGVALAGVLRHSRAWGLGCAGLAVILVIVSPAMFPGREDLWRRRNPRLHALVDQVAALAADGDVVWIADESAFFYAARTGIPVDRYHAISRADEDPLWLVDRLRDARSATACVQIGARTDQQWSTFQSAVQDTWHFESLPSAPAYRIYRMQRLQES